MLTDDITGFVPSSGAAAVANDNLGALAGAGRVGMAAGVLRPGDPDAGADNL